MHGRLIRVAEELVHARPETEDDARAALEWIAARQGIRVETLVAEHGAQPRLRGGVTPA